MPTRAALEAFFAQQERLLAAHGPALAPVQREAYVARLLATGRDLVEELLSAQEAAVAHFTGAPGVAHQGVAPGAGASLEEWLIGELCGITGFPPQAVTRESQFEADLGLDSITLIEVWISLQERFPGVEADEAQLRQLRTLGALADFARAQLSQLPPRDPSVETAPLSATSAETLLGARAEPEAPPALAEHEALVGELRRRLREDFGFEADELQDEVDLEDDLGLDVFSRQALIESVLRDAPRYRLAGRELLHARTLGQLRGLWRRFDPTTAPRALDPLRRYRLRALPHSPTAGELPPGPRLVVGPRQALAALLDAEDQALYLGPQGWRFPSGALDSEDLDLADVGGLARALRRRLGPQPPVVTFLACGDDDSTRALEQGPLALFLLSKALAVSGGPPASLTVLGDESSPGWAGARGVARSLAREWPQSTCRSLWLEGVAHSAGLKRAHALTPGLPFEHDLRIDVAGVVTCGALEEAPLEDGGAPLGAGDQVVIVGASGGIGAALALALARLGCRVAAVGRTAWPTETPYPDVDPGDDAALKRHVFLDLQAKGEPHDPAAIQARFRIVRRQRGLLALRDAVESAGGSWAYASVDGRDSAALGRALEDFASHSPLAGVIHAAGVTQDELLAHKSPQTFRRILLTKASAALALREHLRGAPLRFAVLLSSLAAHTGTAGQTDYAAANEVVNAVAAAWQGEVDYPVRALLFSVWGETGLAGGALLRQMERLGLGTVDTASGVQAILAEAAAAGEPWALLSPATTLRFALGGGA